MGVAVAPIPASWWFCELQRFGTPYNVGTRRNAEGAEFERVAAEENCTERGFGDSFNEKSRD